MTARNRESRVAEPKTRPTGADVDAFLAAVNHPGRRADAQAVRTMMERVTGEPAAMWGPSIVGFGRYRYRQASGREGEMCSVGFSPRAAGLAFYADGFDGRDALLARLGRRKQAKSCFYIAQLADADAAVLEEIVRRSHTAKARA